MADSTIANRQYIPLARYNSLSNTPSTYANESQLGETGEYKGQSFHDILNRTQMTSAQLKSMQPPQANRSRVITAIPQSNQIVSSSQSVPYKIPNSQNTASSNAIPDSTFVPSPDSPYDQKLVEETNKNLEHVPPTIPEGEDLANLMVKNMQDYNTQKAASEAKSTHLPSVPVESGNNSPSSIEVQPETTNSSFLSSSNPAPSSTFHSILSRNAMNSSPEKIQPILPNIPNLDPDDITVLPDEPITTSSNKGFPAYIPSGNIDRQIATMEGSIAPNNSPSSPFSTPSSKNTYLEETDSSNEINTESTETNSENSQFLGAVGSFFGNIASAVTLGFYRPGGETEPTGFARVIDPLKKVVWDAPKSIIVDAPVGAYRDMTHSRDETNSEITPSSNSSERNNTTEHAYRGVRSFGNARNMMRKNFYS